MADILESMERNAVARCDAELFADGTGAMLTCGEFYELTGRVYAYLKQRGIGCEDLVLVCLPRGVLVPAASCGVLRAGAAFVIVEDDLPAERIAYIHHDCGCKLVIDEVAWQEILQTEPLAGYEERDPHSAAFAVYTSGTTGAPKGVLHEYGNIERMLASSPLPQGPLVKNFALISPLNFILSVLAILVLVTKGSTLTYILPFSTAKDPVRFKAFLLEKDITFSFLSPLFVKKMAPILSSLKLAVVGAEPADDLFSEQFAILNGYTMSEVGFVIGAFRIDKPYPNTPVGNPVFDLDIRLMDEGGHEVGPGEKGEIVVENPYVRGYINLPEKTAAAFRDGWYHTGDLGMFDEQGRLVVCGRFDDMAKINGNRVEPGEIEIVARQTLGLSWAAAKVFTEGERSFVCLYYLDDVAIDADAAREKMAERLPYYMLPQFFMHIDEIPLTAAGKFNRRALQAPGVESAQAEYRAPENDAQRALCAAFAKVFKLAQVGIDDDFTCLGGESLDAMEIVVACGLEGLSVADVLQGKTPAGIAALHAERAKAEDVDALNAQALTRDFPLTADQAYTVEWQLREPESTMRSIHTLMKFDKDFIDMGRMSAAITAAAKNHPALMTEIFRTEEGELRQRFTPELLGDIELECLTEAEFACVKDALVEPFAMIGTPLFRARVFQTEAAGYVFVDVHHAVFDGSSSSVFMTDVMAAYMGKELQKDYYPYILAAQDATVFKESKGYFEQRYDGTDWCRHLAKAGEARGSAIGVAKSKLPVTAEQMERAEKSLGISKNGFFAIAAAQALAQSTGEDHVMLFWTFNGRTNARELKAMGSMRCTLPLALSFDAGSTLEELCDDVNEQISGGMAHCRYAYLEQNPAILEDGVTRVLYQGTLQTAPQMPGLLGTVSLRQENLVSRAFMNLEVTDADAGFALMVRYTESCFAPEDIDGFVLNFRNAIEGLTACI